MIDFKHGAKLAALDSKYLEQIRAWRNDPRIWAWCRQMKPVSDLDQEAWFERQSKDSSVQMYSILAEDKLVGVCGFTSIDLINRRAEFSLYIDPKLAGSGLGTAALKTLFDHGFKQWGFNSIWGETFDDNPAHRIFERVGMIKEGTRRDFYFRNGKFIDAHLYSVKASEWKA
jgi:RimJ/RimL family protein N-acetyltransferase